MRNLLVLCTAIAVSALGACVSFDPSGQPMNDVVVDAGADVDAGVATSAPDAEATPPPVDALDDDDRGPGGGGPGGGGPGPGGGGPGGGGPGGGGPGPGGGPGSGDDD